MTHLREPVSSKSILSSSGLRSRAGTPNRLRVSQQIDIFQILVPQTNYFIEENKQTNINIYFLCRKCTQLDKNTSDRFQ